MTMEATDVIRLTELLKDAPRNWGKWGDDDEVGALNYLDAAQVLRGVAAARQGKVFTLQVDVGRKGGDPVWPGRAGAIRTQVIDKGHWISGRAPNFPGGLEYADDFVSMFLQGSTQYDALGHVWYDDTLWNGYPASSTCGGMTKASVYPIAARGVVGHGVLLDMARHRGKDVLGKGETFTHEDLMACAEAQGTPIEKRDILIVRTGWIGSFYTTEQSEFYADFVEPGLTYSPELVQWFADMEIPNLVTDTIANEVTSDPETGVVLPLHAALMRNLGITLTEIASLDTLAADCAEDRQFDFLYTAGPLKIVDGTGAPVNPVVVK
jgi:kynurenine formamidase